MKSKIKIQNPCSEIWETMTDIPEGNSVKFVQKRFGILQKNLQKK